MARPIWSGSITFGLVNIPVQLQMAVHDKTVAFHMMSKDGSCRLRRKLYCPDTGKEFDFSETSRGIEVGKDDYAIVDEKDIKRLRPEKGRAIDIQQFVKLDDIDPIYFDHVYFLAPTNESVKSYRLLYEAMKQRQRVALARFVLRERQYLAAIRIMGDGLVLHTLHYADEVTPLDESLPAALTRAKPAAKEVQIATQLIDSMTRPLDLESYKDDYRLALEKLIEQKRHGKVPVLSDHGDDRPLPRTVNLMDALRRSLKSTGAVHSNGRHPRRRKVRHANRPARR